MYECGGDTYNPYEVLLFFSFFLGGGFARGVLAISVEPFFFFFRNNLISPASGVLRCGFTSSSLSFRNGDLKGGGGGFRLRKMR